MTEENEILNNQESEAPIESDAGESKPKKRVSRRARTVAAVDTAEGTGEIVVQAKSTSRVSARRHVVSADVAESGEESNNSEAAASSSSAAAEQSVSAETAETPAPAKSSRRRRSNTNNNAAEADAQKAESDSGSANGEHLAADSATEEDSAADNHSSETGSNRGDRNERNSRSRYRDRKRRNSNSEDGEPEFSEDDVLIPVAGILDLLDNYAFVRTTGYLPGATDVYVSLGQVKKYNLRKGDAVIGAIRQPREGENQGRQKYNALVKVESVNGQAPEALNDRVEFSDLTPVYPRDRFRLELDPSETSTRLLDLFAPIAKGQRGLVIGGVNSGKSKLIQAITQSISANNPETHIMVVLVDGPAEEVTEFQRTVKGEVISSSYEHPAEDHITVVELALDRAKRLVELGHDVVLIVDSITKLGYAYGVSLPNGGAFLETSGTESLLPLKRIFASARSLEEGGSLTILGTALIGGVSSIPDYILEELQTAANSEIWLSSAKALTRQFPAVDLLSSATRNDELILGTEELRVVNQLRQLLSDDPELQTALVETLTNSASNVEFLVRAQKEQLSGANNSKQA